MCVRPEIEMSQGNRASLGVSYKKLGQAGKGEIGDEGVPLCEAGRTSVPCWVLQCAWGPPGVAGGPGRPHLEPSVHTALSQHLLILVHPLPLQGALLSLSL